MADVMNDVNNSISSGLAKLEENNGSKKRYKTYTEEALRECIASIQSGQRTANAAAEFYKIPRTTVFRRLAADAVKVNGEHKDECGDELRTDVSNKVAAEQELISEKIKNALSNGRVKKNESTSENDVSASDAVGDATSSSCKGSENGGISDTIRTASGLSITVVESSSSSVNDEGDAEDVEKNNSNVAVDLVVSSDEKAKRKKSATITPRRSSRNLNKQRNYEENLEEDDLQLITPTDPLADETKLKSRPKSFVVNDTKELLQVANNTKPVKGNNTKEPTLVIIDTKSILTGKGPIPLSQSNSYPNNVSSAHIQSALKRLPPSHTAFSVIPIGVPPTGLHPQNIFSQYKPPPPQMKPIVIGPPSTAVSAAPITFQSTAVSISNSSTATGPSVTGSVPTKQPPQQQIVLPSLTDDMFVVEAPSFIVPYVYEKPAVKAIRKEIEEIEDEIKEAKDKAEKERKEKDEEELKENKEKQDAEKVKDCKKEKDEADCEMKGKDAEDVTEVKMEKAKDGEVKMNADEDIESKPKDALKSEEEGEDEEAAAAKKKEDGEKKDETTKDDSKTAAISMHDKKTSHFDSPLGKFFFSIGLNLVQEFVQNDLLRSQKRKRDREGENCPSEVLSTIDELTKTLEVSQEHNDGFKMALKKCELCSFKTESNLVMAHHLETPHMRNYTYRCNFCASEVRSPHDILFHMEAEHNVRGRLERAPAFHQCANCPFEDNQKGKLTRHRISCDKKYKPERNQEPPLDWEPPAKIPRVTRSRPPAMNSTNAVHQASMCGVRPTTQNSLLPKLLPTNTAARSNLINMNKRANLSVSRFQNHQQIGVPPRFQNVSQGSAMMYQASPNSQHQIMLPQAHRIPNTSIYQTQNLKHNSMQNSLAAAKLLNQPSISITPLPRQSSQQSSAAANASNAKPGKPTSGRNNVVICEICDGYIKDLEQLRNHMQWIHKVKIHPKMIYNTAPLNCQKCQYRFFTDQGLERHLLGSHGLVTSSMQEAANKEKDGGRCPICGRVYQWKLLNHVGRDHQMTLKPAHLSYKCTVCTATFGMYKQFENHVYTAHSGVARRSMDGGRPSGSQASGAATAAQNEALLRPLKINDEITIIPQPMRPVRMPRVPAGTSIAMTTKNKMRDDNGGGLRKKNCGSQNFRVKREFNEHETTSSEIKAAKCEEQAEEDAKLMRQFNIKPLKVSLTKYVNLSERFVYKILPKTITIDDIEVEVASLMPITELKVTDKQIVLAPFVEQMRKQAAKRFNVVRANVHKGTAKTGECNMHRSTMLPSISNVVSIADRNCDTGVSSSSEQLANTSTAAAVGKEKSLSEPAASTIKLLPSAPPSDAHVQSDRARLKIVIKAKDGEKIDEHNVGEIMKKIAPRLKNYKYDQQIRITLRKGPAPASSSSIRGSTDCSKPVEAVTIMNPQLQKILNVRSALSVPTIEFDKKPTVIQDVISLVDDSDDDDVMVLGTDSSKSEQEERSSALRASLRRKENEKYILPD